MADDGLSQRTNVWPRPKPHFQVKWGAAVMSFQEITGLTAETQPIEYRGGDSPGFSTTKISGLNKHGDVMMKRGVVAADNRFWDWLNDIRTNPVKRVPVTISLLDEAGAPAMVWTLHKAWPAKVTGPDLKATGNDVAIDTLEISHEGVTVDNC